MQEVLFYRQQNVRLEFLTVNSGCHGKITINLLTFSPVIQIWLQLSSVVCVHRERGYSPSLLASEDEDHSEHHLAAGHCFF